MKERFVGVSALRTSLAEYIDMLLSGDVERIVVLKSNSPIGVMVSYGRYKELTESITAPQGEES